jgi:hypothetical protein
MTSRDSNSYGQAAASSVGNGSSTPGKKLVCVDIEEARRRFAAACSSSPLYQARLAKDPEYFKRCSPGRFLWPETAD